MDDDGSRNNRPRVAAARWGLLRAALKGVQPDESLQSASIHRFPGFQLLGRQQLEEGADDDFLQRLHSQSEATDDVESLLWSFHCCLSTSEKGGTVELSYNQHELISDNVRAKLAGNGILCRLKCDQEGNQSLQVSLPPNNDYICVDYRLGDDPSSSSIIRVRERLPSPKINLQALTSQQNNDGVDNTGNTRVWDSETTLSYLLLQDAATILSTLEVSSLWDLSVNGQERLRVLELGAGMAGLAGLFLATLHPEETHVVLTDGHPDAVQNNRVNIQLNRALHPDNSNCNNITAERLVWTTDSSDTNDEELFDLVLASDCTHFTEFHAALALTVANKLRIGGVALMLQPPRGQSLQQFVDCLQSCDDLFDIHWLKDDYSKTLTNLHEEYSSKENGVYDANIHYPQLLILRKQRNASESDRLALVQHMEERIKKDRV